MPRAAAAVTTKSQAAARILVGPSFCQNAMSNSRPGARPRTSLLMMTRSAIPSVSAILGFRALFRLAGGPPGSIQGSDQIFA